MVWPNPHPSRTRVAVEALIRDGTGVAEIAERTGVPPSTVQAWRRRLAAPQRKRTTRRPLCPESWPTHRRRAAARLLAEPGTDPCDLALALGGVRAEGQALRRALGVPQRRKAAATRAATAPGLGDLDAAMRAHIGREIAARDARLKAEGPDLDSGRALRELGGLKRMLDDLAERAGQVRDGDADGEPQEDLAVLRDRIARRYAAFAPDWAESRIRGDPGAEPAEGARP